MIGSGLVLGPAVSIRYRVADALSISSSFLFPLDFPHWDSVQAGEEGYPKPRGSWGKVWKDCW